MSWLSSGAWSPTKLWNSDYCCRYSSKFLMFLLECTGCVKVTSMYVTYKSTAPLSNYPSDIVYVTSNLPPPLANCPLPSANYPRRQQTAPPNGQTTHHHRQATRPHRQTTTPSATKFKLLPMVKLPPISKPPAMVKLKPTSTYQRPTEESCTSQDQGIAQSTNAKPEETPPGRWEESSSGGCHLS